MRRRGGQWVRFFPVILLGLVFFPGAGSQAAERCVPWVAKLVSVEGTIEVKHTAQGEWSSATLGDTFCVGDTIRLQQWRAAIRLNNETMIRLDAGTTLTFTKVEDDTLSWLNIIKGLVHFMSRVPRSLTVTTPFVNGTIEGTEFLVEVVDEQATIWVFEGRIFASNESGNLTLVNGQAAVSKSGQAPALVTVVKPWDAVQWALYYPPLIDYRPAEVKGDDATIIRSALESYRQNDLSGALSQLESIPEARRDVQFYLLRAGLLLSVGRVEQARADLAEARRLEPGNGRVLALQSVIAVVQNDKEAALRLAREAREQAPESPATWLALSYAYQAGFDIEKAQESVEQALKINPADALAWARLSELWLSRGYLDRSLEAAQQAVARNPDLAHTQTVLGFAYLTQFKIEEAKAAFQKAIQLDQAAPLPRMGLGLAKIRVSNLAEGRRDIEIAAGLDPNNAIIRSYLGKAYFEEKRDPLDGTQFDIAKELDPRDPTPWFYDALRKQLINQPVEALHDLQESIRLNDNRVVSRSGLLMDKDEAVRNATVGRIYQNLGFQQRALVEGWYGITVDPASQMAHRLLADSYSALPRHDIARVSELLQSQLLQEINTNNLQPQLAERNIQILEGAGPAVSSFNEFNPIFMRNNVRVLGDGLVGNLGTSAYSVVPSILYDRFSLSGGVFQYWTDGFRRNNDVKDTIYNVFGQAAVTSKLNIQAEYRERHSEQGDVAFNFDPDNFQRTFRQDTDQWTYRFGSRYALAPHSDFLVSFIHGNFQQDVDQPGLSGKTDQDRNQVEGQYLFRHDLVTATVGGRWAKGNQDTRLFFNGALASQIKDDPKDSSGYVYLNVKWPQNVIWTGGLAVESIDNITDDEVRVSPKAGVQWNITERARLRLGYFQRLQRRLTVAQTIEPTQVAGFNQLFDDIDSSHTERWGAGLDTNPTDNIYVGAEYTLRKIEAPLIDANTFETFRFERWEDLARAYVYWTPH
ncbi:MAG TPA: TonB-dependent receptor, partial [Nitrospiraceae bacterium]|nr:TonB-dependent receptor [Nitrospiraceae bacterium]